MNNRILIAQYILVDPSGNKKRFRIRMLDDGTLTYSLLGYTNNIGFAISSIQLKVPLPAMRYDGLDDTLRAVNMALATGLYKTLQRDIYAKVA